VLARLFRGKMLTMLMDACDAGELRSFNTQCRTRRQESIQVLHPVQRMAMLTTITRADVRIESALAS
jgi:hypothetical protein